MHSPEWSSCHRDVARREDTWNAITTGRYMAPSLLAAAEARDRAQVEAYIGRSLGREDRATQSGFVDAIAPMEVIDRIGRRIRRWLRSATAMRQRATT
jgi:hypothetical protein